MSKEVKALIISTLAGVSASLIVEYIRNKRQTQQGGSPWTS